MSDGIGPLAGLGIGTAILAVGAAAWFGYWQLHGSAVNRENDIVQHSHAMQQGDIANDRQLVLGWNTADNPGQKIAIANQFCATLQDVTDVPPDLATAKTQICTSTP